jgi:hypothetical protein
MMKRHDNPERDAIPDMNSLPISDPGNSIGKKAALSKTRQRTLAKKLRKNSRMVSLGAEISSGIEEIAELSDKIIESFEIAKTSINRIAKNSNEEIKLWSAVFESSGKALEISQANSAAGESAASAFKRNFHSLEDVHESIVEGAQVHNEIFRKSQELGKLNEIIDDLDVRINSLIEQSDLAALNADLEAGKAGDSGAGYAVIAGMLKKTSVLLSKRSEGFHPLLTRIRSIQSGVSARVAEASEKIRTVDVLTAGVRNAFAEMAGSIDVLHLSGEKISSAVSSVFPFSEEEISEGDTGLFLDSVMDSINQTFSLIEKQEDLLSDAAIHAETILEATGKLPSAENAANALDVVFAGIDSFIKSLEGSIEHLKTILPLLNNAIQDAGEIGKNSASNPEYLTRLFQSAQGLLSTVRSSQETIEKILNSISPSHAILQNVIRELQILKSEQDAFLAELREFEPLRQFLSRFADTIRDFSTRVDFLGAEGGIEAARHGAKGTGFIALSKELSAIGDDSAGFESSILDYCGRLEDIAHSLINKETNQPWESIFHSLTGIAEDVRALLENLLISCSRENAALFSLFSEHIRRIDSYREKHSESLKNVSSAVQALTQAAKFEENQENAFNQAISTAEKISLLADELYPEES